MAGINNEYLNDHKLFRMRNKKIIALFPMIAVLVAIIVFWCLKLIGITITSDALCGVDEHIHSEECYSAVEADSDTTNANSEKTLICLKPEHTHSSECFPDRTSDKETVGDWLATFEDVEITNNVAENLLGIASSQVGYTESSLNYEYDQDAEKHGYTRYGEWYGSPYGKWNTIFVSFCINYANINNSDSLINASAEAMRLAWQERKLYSAADTHTALLGDVVFFDIDSNGKADRTGIVAYASSTKLITIEGDVDGAVDKVVYDNTDSVLGYGMTGELYAAKHITDESTEQSEENVEVSTDVSGELNFYIPDANGSETLQSVFNAEPLVMMSAKNQNILYTSHLEDEVVNAVFRELSGAEITTGSTVYIGETYIVSLEFSEINTGSQWIQFEHDDNGYLTYHVPENLHCEPFDSWHIISAKTENGTIEDVGEYFVDESGLLRVRFYNDSNGENFVDKYSNVDFTIDFNVTVASTQTGSSTEVVFNDKIKVDLEVDGGAKMQVSKTHGEYDSENNMQDFTVKVEATHGVVHDLFLYDDIWENHHVLRDTIVVTDLNGNILDPQPIIGDNPQAGANFGFSLSGFPDFSAGHGFLINYKSAINDNLLSQDKAGMWNGVGISGTDSDGNEIPEEGSILWAADWVEVELEKLGKDGKQAVLYDQNGNSVPVIEWELEIRKSQANLQGTVVVDTLGQGLEYYTAEPIRVERYDEFGNKLSDAYIRWDNITVNGNSMTFALPDAFACKLVYYTTYEIPDNTETINYSNSAKVTINGKEEHTSGSADVVGFIPKVIKSASGNDGKYVYFTVEADVPGVIKDWGSFFLSDLSAFWGYENAEGFLYVENKPEDVVISATTASGQTVVFTPYIEGGTVENTYILVAPGIGDLNHSFNILFNTADIDTASSKWILDEDSKLTISYKLPFDSKTGVEWQGELTGDLTVEDVLLSGKTLANEVYLNYTNIITGTGTASYEYSPTITKKSVIHEDGTIDYTVTFRNSIPGSYGNSGYLTSAQAINFIDTFDERMEYVPGSLTVTCYDPWRSNLWLNKYVYNGTVQGNEINISGTDLVFDDYNYAEAQYNPDGSAMWGTWLSTCGTYQAYCNAMQGGNHVFTYTLKLKDEYLFTTEHAKIELDNTAELTWSNKESPDNTSGEVTDSAEFVTGLVDKVAVQDNTKIDFDIHINSNALDILVGSDTLTIEDTMTENLSVYWRTIKLLYQDPDGSWVDFDSENSKYSYSVVYDQPNNRLTFVVPDELHIRIDYTTLITEAGLVSINNSVKINGKAEVSDIVDALFRVEQHSGGASGSNHEIILLKQDGVSKEPLPNATFILYGPMGDPNASPPTGVSSSIVTEDGSVLYYIGTYTTGAAGTVLINTQYLTMGGPYALVEKTAPSGYNRREEPIYFYFYATDPNGIIQTVTTLIAVENYSGGFQLPETGSYGIFFTAIIGAALVVCPILYSSIRRKRERRLG